MTTLEMTERALELTRGFLKSLGQSVKLVSLYSLAHPVPASSQQETWHLLHDLFSETGWPQIVITLTGGRWLVNGRVVADSAHAYELLALAFRAHALQSVAVRPECRLYESRRLRLGPAAVPVEPSDAPLELEERGVRHLADDAEGEAAGGEQRGRQA